MTDIDNQRVQRFVERWESGDRTPTEEAFVEETQALDSFIGKLRAEVPYETLDDRAMSDVRRWLKENYVGKHEHSHIWPDSTERTVFTEGVDCQGYDIGWRLCKEEVRRQLDAEGRPNDELVDAVYGWLYNRKGTVHDEKQRDLVEGVIQDMGVKEFQEAYLDVRDRHRGLTELGWVDRRQTFKERHPGIDDEAGVYVTVFTQWDRGTRAMYVERLVPALHRIHIEDGDLSTIERQIRQAGLSRKFPELAAKNPGLYNRDL